MEEQRLEGYSDSVCWMGQQAKIQRNMRGDNSHPAWTVDPTMKELEDHTAAGLKWVQDNSGAGGAAETNMMLLSAWNEHDEGHWIEPALEQYGGTEKLQAISRALGRAAARARAGSDALKEI